MMCLTGCALLLLEMVRLQVLWLMVGLEVRLLLPLMVDLLGGSSGMLQLGYCRLDLSSQSQCLLLRVSLNQYLNEPSLSMPMWMG